MAWRRLVALCVPLLLAPMAVGCGSDSDAPTAPGGPAAEGDGQSRVAGDTAPARDGLGQTDASATPDTAAPGLDAVGEPADAVDGPDDSGPDAHSGDAVADAAGGVSEPVGPVQISAPGGVFDSETHVVVAPTGRTLAVWMRIGFSGVENAYAVSGDRGATFPAASTLEGTATKGDPVAAAGPDGSLYYGFLGGVCARSGCAQGHVWVARMAPDASTFGPPVDASPADPEEFYDKPWLMMGPDNALILVVAARRGAYPSNVDRILAARSVDGQVWTHAAVVPTGPVGQLAGIPHACVSHSGTRLWVLHVDSTSPTWATLRWSDDLGATWPTANASTGFALLEDANGLQSYDLRCAGEGDDVWVQYGVADGVGTTTAIPPLARVTVAHSPDGGTTWDRRTQVNPEETLVLRPELVLEPSGALDVVAYTGAAEGDPTGDVHWWRSTDGGVTFEDRGPLHSPILFTGERDGTAWVGDYSGLAVDGVDLFATFVDNTSGSSRVLFARRPLP